MADAATVQENTEQKVLVTNEGMAEFFAKHQNVQPTQPQESKPESKSDSGETGKPGATDVKPEDKDGKDGKKEDYLADDPFVNKLRDENRKYRAERKQAKKEVGDLRSEVTKLRKQLDGTSEEETQLTEEQKQFQADYEAKMKISKKEAIKRWGEEKVEETFLDEEAPWRKIEERSAEGEAEAFIMNQRVRLSDDPYSTAMDILEEEALFEKYGTRNLTELVKKAQDQAVKDKAEEVSNKLRETNRRGAPVETLSSVRGGSDNTETKPQGQVPLAEMKLFSHLK